jgi:hypothetical protein
LFLAIFVGCATPAPPPSPPAAPAAAVPEAVGSHPVVGAAAFATEVAKIPARKKALRASEIRNAANSITIECSVKLPEDPTDNPELCRGFRFVVVDEAGEESPRFRIGNNARYFYSARDGKKYRVRPVIGKNWEFSVDPDRDLVMGDRVRVQLRQKE